MSATSHRPRRVLIAGGGVAALETALALRRLAAERVRIELVAPESEFVYRPLLVAAPFGRPVVRAALDELLDGHDIERLPDRVTSVDAGRRRVRMLHGEELAYDELVIATGARPGPPRPGMVTFGDPEELPAFELVLRMLHLGSIRDVVFAVPSRSAWSLPLYELALQTGADLARAGVQGAGLTVVTPEPAALHAFGRRAAPVIESLLARCGVRLVTSTLPFACEGDRSRIAPGAPLQADVVVTMPELHGPRIPGLPHDRRGFIPIDPHGRVPGVEGVFAAGDAVSYPTKQGGVAAQQACAVAEALAALAGAPVRPRPCRPVLHGLLLTGDRPRYLRTDPGARAEAEVADEPLWWPGGKIFARHLAPELAARSAAFEAG